MSKKVAWCEAQHKFDPERRRVAVEGLRLCYGCRSGLEKDLALLPGFWVDLHSGVARSLVGGLSRSEPLVSGTREVGLVYDRAALNCAEQIERDLAYFAKEILGHPGAVVSVAVPRLRREIDRVAGHALAGNVREVCRELVGQSYAILDPAGRPKEVGPCMEIVELEGRRQLCTGNLTLRGFGAKADLSCSLCGIKIPPRKWKRYAAAYARRATRDVEVRGEIL